MVTESEELVLSDAPRNSSVAILAQIALLATAMQMAVFYYPLALPRALGFSPFRPYALSLPAISVLSALSLPVLLMTFRRWTHDKPVGICVLIYCVFVVTSAATMGSDVRNTLTALGRVTIPVAIAIGSVRFSTSGLVGNFYTIGFCLIWVVNVYSCIVLGRISGTGGNQNRVAAVTVATAPFVLALFEQCLSLGRRWMVSADALEKPENAERGHRFPLVGGIIVSALVLWTTSIVVVKTGCRAAVVAAVGYVMIRILEIGSFRIRLLTVTVLCATGVLALSTSNFEWRQFHLTQSRLAIWQSTLDMISDHPVVGHGPNQFIETFVKYKSLDLNQRVGNTISHPHNELLRVAANLGIPAAITWLICCLLAIGPGHRSAIKDSCWQASRIGAIMLLGCSMFGRPLDDSPSSIIFLILIGILLAKRLPSCFGLTATSRFDADDRPSDSKSALTDIAARLVVGATCAVAFAFVAKEFYVHIASWNLDRRGRLLTMVAEQTADSVTARSLFQKAYSRHKAATGFNSSDLRFQHHAAGYIASESLEQPDIAREHYRQILRTHPQAGFTNYLMGRCFLREAGAPGLSEYQRVSNLESAVEFLKRDLKIHPFATRVHEQLIVALAQLRQHSQVCDAHSQLSSIYQQRLQRVCDLNKVTPASLANNWQSNGYRQDAAQRLTEHVAFSNLNHVVIQQMFPEMKHVQSFLRHTEYLQDDASFWYDHASLSREFSGVLSAEDLLKQISQVSTSASQTEEFAWPQEVWKRRMGTPWEAACLLTAIAERYEQVCLSLWTGETLVSILHWNGDVYRCEPATWQWQRITRQEWEAMSTDQRRQAITSSTSTDSHETLVFVYPHAFRHRNRALFDVVNNYSDEWKWPHNPYVTIANAAVAFPEFAAPEFAIEPFERLELDLSE